MTKKFYQSKTFWFGVLTVVVGVAGLFGFADYAPSTDLEQAMEIVLGAITILLRFLTKEPVSL